MPSDEEQIRALVSTWMSATKSGDAETVLNLVAEDAVFLLPGRPPMRKAELAEGLKAQAARTAPKFDGSNEIQEIIVSGDWAFMWARLAVTVTPQNDAPPIKRDGHTLTVFQKQAGKWLLARDANLLAPSKQDGK